MALSNRIYKITRINPFKNKNIKQKHQTHTQQNNNTQIEHSTSKWLSICPRLATAINPINLGVGYQLPSTKQYLLFILYEETL